MPNVDAGLTLRARPPILRHLPSEHGLTARKRAFLGSAVVALIIGCATPPPRWSAPAPTVTAPLTTTTTTEPPLSIGDDWTRVVKVRGGFAIYVNYPRLRRDGAYLMVWERYQSPDGTHRVTLEAYDCQHRQSRMLQLVRYSPNGSVEVSEHYTEQQEPFSVPAPESVGETVMNAVCR